MTVGIRHGGPSRASRRGGAPGDPPITGVTRLGHRLEDGMVRRPIVLPPAFNFTAIIPCVRRPAFAVGAYPRALRQGPARVSGCAD